MEEASEQLFFLVQQHGFAHPFQRVGPKEAIATLNYVKGELLLEALLDTREGDVEIDIGRKPPPGGEYYFSHDDKGRRVRVGLTKLLRKRGTMEYKADWRKPNHAESERERFRRGLSSLLASYRTTGATSWMGAWASLMSCRCASGALAGARYTGECSRNPSGDHWGPRARGRRS